MKWFKRLWAMLTWMPDVYTIRVFNRAGRRAGVDSVPPSSMAILSGPRAPAIGAETAWSFEGPTEAAAIGAAVHWLSQHGRLHDPVVLRFPANICGFEPADPIWAPCTREAGHDGPCAHPYRELRE